MAKAVATFALAGLARSPPCARSITTMRSLDLQKTNEECHQRINVKKKTTNP